MRIVSTEMPSDDPTVRIRDLWPLLAGPMILGGIIFWVMYAVYMWDSISRRLEVKWKPLPPSASVLAEPGK